MLFKRRREAGQRRLDANREASAEVERVFAQSPEANAARAGSTAPTQSSSVHPTGTQHGISSDGTPTDEYEHARRRIIASSERSKPPYSSHEIFSDYLEMGAHSFHQHQKRDKMYALNRAGLCVAKCCSSATWRCGVITSRWHHSFPLFTI